MRKFTKKHLKKMQAGLKKYRRGLRISEGKRFAKIEREINIPAKRIERKIRPPVRKLVKMPDNKLKKLAREFEIYSLAYDDAKDKIEDILQDRRWRQEEKQEMEKEKLRKVI
jgi:hypothetical protein